MAEDNGYGTVLSFLILPAYYRFFIMQGATDPWLQNKFGKKENKVEDKALVFDW